MIKKKSYMMFVTGSVVCMLKELQDYNSELQYPATPCPSHIILSTQLTISKFLTKHTYSMFHKSQLTV